MKTPRRGMCDNDYRKWLRSTKPRKLRTAKPLKDRLLAKIEVTAAGCWQWTGSYEGTGYGKIWDFRVKTVVPAHRASYEVFKGEIPEGFEVDHLCRNKGCIRPEHLEAVTPTENKRRARAYLVPRCAKITHCPKGHPYDEANTRLYVKPGGGVARFCRACDRIRDASRREAARASAA